MKQQLRKRITEEFELRGTARNTRLTYLRCIERFERHMVKGAAGLGREAVREFLLHLVEQGLSPSTHNVYAAALHFLYARVLRRPRVVDELPRRKAAFKLPEVLTQAEVARLFEALPSPRHRAAGTCGRARDRRDGRIRSVSPVLPSMIVSRQTRRDDEDRREVA